MKLLLLLSLFPLSLSCGNFCGPGFCGGARTTTVEGCNWNAPTQSAYGTPCVDRCCKEHDVCCFNEVNGTEGCNHGIVDCLSQCDALDATCLYGVLPVPSFLVSTVMSLVSDWCCGGPC